MAETEDRDCLSDGTAGPNMHPQFSTILSAEDVQGGSDWEVDSTLGSDTRSYTTSVAESVLNYEYENGRRYHSSRAGSYPMPNDDAEQVRMDMQHHIYSMLLEGELCTAPIGPNIQRILDVGTGTGLWAIDMADKYPSAEVVATDLSIIQPLWVPPNLRFEIDDCELDWSYVSKFDYIHIRSMGGSIGDWPRLLRRVYENLHPGAWVELMDFETQAQTDDGSLPPNSAWAQYQAGINEAASRFGKLMNAAPHYRQYVLGAGFEDVTEVIHKVPLSPWPADPKLKEVGRWMVPQMAASVEPYALALFSRVLGWSNAQIQVLLEGVRNELRNLNHHLYSKVHIVCGRKPLS